MGVHWEGSVNYNPYWMVFWRKTESFVLGDKDISGPSHEGVCLSEQGELETARARIHLWE